MFAYQLPIDLGYRAWPTLISWVAAAAVSAIALGLASRRKLTLMRLLAGALAMGGGICAMHYIGMAALHASAMMQHAPAYVAASLAVAMGASGLALWLAAGRGGRPPLLLSATAFGLAISGMHYTAMAGLTLYPHAPASSAPVLSSDLLAIVVAIVAFLVSVVFLLFLVPDRSAPTEPLAVPSASVPAAGDFDVGQGGFGPLGGAGAPPRRLARHLPIEREGVTHFVAVDHVVAVHANAHYTYIFDGTSKLFCPLAIGDVEARLDTNRFVRVHRSHIINIERVAGLKRAGDSGLVEMAGADRYAVPVSRSRVGSLKSRISARMAEAAE